PEIGPTTRFSLADRTPVEGFREARELGIETRPVLVGPLRFLLLSKQDADSPRDFRPLNKLDELLAAYVTLLDELRQAGAEWVQLHAPACAADRTQEELDQLRVAYRKLGELTNRPNILVSGYFGDLGDAVDVLASAPIEGLAVDLVTESSTVDRLASCSGLRDKTLVAGLIDGRNIWRTDLDKALTTAATVLGSAAEIAVSTS